MRLFVLRAVVLVILTLSGALLTDYLSAAPAYCGFQAGCDAVIFSSYGRVAGMPLPLLSIIGFGLFFLLTLFPEGRMFWLTAPLSVLAGAGGLVLILVQILGVKLVCPLCMFVDCLAIGLAVVRLYGGKPVALSGLSRTWLAAWMALALLAVTTPPLLALLKPEPHAPDQVRAHWVKGTVTVVEVMDFECVYCWKAEPVLQGFLRKHGKEIHFVRVIAPGVQNRAAARAYLAAQAQGKAEEMAQLIFLNPLGSPPEYRELATSLDLNLKDYDSAIKDPETDALLQRNLAWAQEVGKGLPVIWVQNHALQGMPTSGALEGAWRRAKHGLATAPQAKAGVTAQTFQNNP